MSDCCDPKTQQHVVPKKKKDLLLWATTIIIIAAYGLQFFAPIWTESIAYFSTFAAGIFELMNRMAWGLLLGVIFVGLLDHIPRELLTAALGKGGTFRGIVRATLAGVLLDLCSHGVLLVGTKLYGKGASLGQVMAFLIASPWNSLSLTVVLWALMGFKWMMTLLILSMLIALISGMIFDKLVKAKVLPNNPHSMDLPEGYTFKKGFKNLFKGIKFKPVSLVWNGFKGSKMILRWIFFGVILAALIRTFVSPENFAIFFGPTLTGLGLTVIIATILEVCSEGSAPIAADLLTRAKAPGNSFAFLMTGVSTDYTEMLALKEATKSWKISLFLPLITLPQVILLAWLLNQGVI